MELVMDLPYRAEYAKSNRSSCRSCKSNIGKDTLRLAVMVQSPMFDGKVPNWYHMSCFFGKQRPRTVGDIAHFESLRYEDQTKIQNKVDSLAGTSSNGSSVGKGGKGKKRSASSALSPNLKDFTLEYSKSGRATCRGCEQKILKDEIRISKKDYETDVGKKFGGQDMWHHVECFAKLRAELVFYDSGDKLPGYKTLSNEDQVKVKKWLPKLKQEDVAAKKVKKEEKDEVDSVDAEIRNQCKLIYKYRDALKNLKKKELESLLECNDQAIPVGTDRMLDRLSDGMAFGALKPCAMCGGGQLVFHKTGYLCQGDLTEWTKCQQLFKEPKRTVFKVPTELKDHYPFLDAYKCKPTSRIIRFTAPSAAVKKEEDEVDHKPKVERARPTFYGMNFVVTGFDIETRTDLESKISKMGGKVFNSLSKGVIMAVVSTPAEVEKMSRKIKQASDQDVQVVSQDFVKEAEKFSTLKKTTEDVPALVLAKSICTWGSDPVSRLPAPAPLKSAKSMSMFTRSLPSKQTMRLKGGLAVDPDSGLEDTAHVYQSGTDKYNAVLGLTDLQTQRNSYYKIQLLEADSKNKYWVFRAWGRIATTIGSNKLEKMTSLFEAKQHFKALFEEKTGNMWDYRHEFTKVPGRMYPIDVDYEQDIPAIQLDDGVDSKLHSSVQDLIRLIFDVNKMNKLMAEFELDLDKMPLGKLSKKQIQRAYVVLSEIQALLDATHQNTQQLLLDASNRFYTFIPHSFGIETPPIICTKEMLKDKLEMLDSLTEMALAYDIMRTDQVDGKSNIDSHYEKLKCELVPLEPHEDHHQLIKQYVSNTHAETHSHYELEVDKVFAVKRQGEDKRYRPFRKLHNKKLLWHGSRTTNFAGILSQGLRIAPPEAPSAGYMFGKGIYFADMVSKSANYCCTSHTNNEGLLLLCEVALGKMHELTQADYIEKLPKGKHSTKGVGMTQPAPNETVLRDGVEIPLGKPVKMDGTKSSLLYNEYIVYDVAQVNIKYLVKVNFNYKL